MKKNQFFVLILIFFSIRIVSGQQLSPFVVSTSGGFYSNSTGMLSFTTGEMSAVETYTSSTAILTQGFQQAFDFGTYINEHPDLNFSFGIQPNPTDGFFKLITESSSNNHVAVRIMDVLGRNIFSTNFYHEANTHVEYVDLSHVPQGIYLIALTVKEKNVPRSENHYITKIHIVR